MKFLSGLILIDAPHSALNMMGIDENATEGNKTIVKKLKCGKDFYVYVSSQAWRYWWRETLKEKFNWELSPIYREQKQVFTEANPIKYPDDDVFGYMKAIEGKTVTRISPLKNTPLVSILPTRSSLTNDVATASRHEGDPVPYETEFYSTVLKGAFSLDLDSVGRFTLIDKAGFRNLIIEEDISSSSKSKKKKNINKSIIEELLKLADEYNIEKKEKEWLMPADVRAKRAIETIKALKYLYGGAKQTLFLTDVTPKLIILAFFDGGINPFISDIFYEDKGEIKFNEQALKGRLTNFYEILNPKKIFVGYDEGFIKKWNLENILDLSLDNIEITYDSISNVLELVAKEIENFYKG